MQFFLFALLLNEINDENWSKMPEIVMKQTQTLLRNIGHRSGKITLRDFKVYLLAEGVRNETDLQALYELFEMTLKAYKRCMKKKTDKTEKSTTAHLVYQNMKDKIT